MKKNETKWSCDRCGSESVQPERGQPDGWCGVQMYAPPLHVEPHGGRQHLCPECTDQYLDFMKAEL